MYLQRLGDAEYDDGAGTALGALHEADIVAVEPRQRREIFLADAFGLAMAADFPPKRQKDFLFAVPHARSVASCRNTFHLPAVRNSLARFREVPFVPHDRQAVAA